MVNLSERNYLQMNQAKYRAGQRVEYVLNGHFHNNVIKTCHMLAGGRWFYEMESDPWVLVHEALITVRHLAVYR